MDNNQQPESKVAKTLFLSLSSFLVVAISVIMVLMLIGALISLVWPHTNDFSTRIILPIFSISTLLTIILSVFLLKNLYRTGTFLSNKKLLLVFIAVIIIPFFLIILYEILSPSQRIVYLEGITLQSCETGRPSVPWGATLEKGSCYSYFGQCNKITDNFYSRQCIDNHMELFVNYESCNSMQSNKEYCLSKISVQKKDVLFCKDLKDPRERWICVGGIIDPNGHMPNKVSGFSTTVSDKISFCKTLNGIEADYCFESIIAAGWGITNLTPEGISLCNMISDQYPWIREDCKIIK